MRRNVVIDLAVQEVMQLHGAVGSSTKIYKVLEIVVEDVLFRVP